MAGRLAEHYTAWAVEVTKMAQASSLLTAWWRHSVPDRALVESRFTTSTPMHSNPRTKATTRRTLEVERRLHGLASRPHQPRHRSGIHCVARREEKPFDARKRTRGRTDPPAVRRA